MIPLADHRDRVVALESELAALDLPPGRWTAELVDGFAVDRARARFVVAAYRATLDHLAGDDDAAHRDRDEAAAILDDATATVAHRHGDRHDPASQLVGLDPSNHTIYGYGYLYTADTLCYWHRELFQIDAILNNTDETPPACVL